MGKEVSKHLLLSATPTKQKCFKGNEGQKTWECLKKTLKKFENDPSTKNVHILRSKADCLRVCKNGPILLIWPDGIWYEKVSPEKISEIFSGETFSYQIPSGQTRRIGPFLQILKQSAFDLNI